MSGESASRPGDVFHPDFYNGYPGGKLVAHNSISLMLTMRMLKVMRPVD